MNPDRVYDENDRALREDGDYVLYWMIANRRARMNFALEHAANLAEQLNKPLVVFEPLRSDHLWASRRIARFVADGMRDNAAAFDDAPVTYLPYVEATPGAGKGLLAALAKRACVVVTDYFPCFFLPRMVRAAGEQLDVKLLSVDANGILPIASAGRFFPTAHSFRRFLQKNVLDHLLQMPKSVPIPELPRLDPASLQVDGWTFADVDDPNLAAFPDTPAEAPVRGGARAAHEALSTFLAHGLDNYGEGRNHPDEDHGQSGLSPWLHFGHIGAHEVVRAVFDTCRWGPDQLSNITNGSKSGFWGLASGPEAFLDELITWRELGYVFCHYREDYAQFESLPDWAIKTLDEHAGDARVHRYTLEQFESASTHDELWNAAQRQLVREGRMHNYLRMLWGKKILHWSEHPRAALDIMIELNNKYALDGRNPNSYSGIFWVLGRFDRAWGPEREVFGKVRYMTSDSTRKKLKLKQYLARYG